MGPRPADDAGSPQSIEVTNTYEFGVMSRAYSDSADALRAIEQSRFPRTDVGGAFGDGGITSSYDAQRGSLLRALHSLQARLDDMSNRLWETELVYDGTESTNTETLRRGKPF
jgi:hypothetical protein